MISYVKGTILHKSGTGVVVLNQNIGYDILLPINRLPKYSVQQEVEFFTYFHVREDIMQLYGFESWAEKDFFLLLLNVSGVGPKGALAIIGQSTLSGIHQAIANENIAFLTKVPGIGQKTAQRLILELKDKLPVGEGLITDLATDEGAQVSAGIAQDIVAVLISLGYHENEVRRILPQLKDSMAVDDEQTVVKKALKLLARL